MCSTIGSPVFYEDLGDLKRQVRELEAEADLMRSRVAIRLMACSDNLHERVAACLPRLPESTRMALAVLVGDLFSAARRPPPSLD